MTVQTIQGAGIMPATSAVVDIPQGLPAEMAAIVQWANTAEAARRLVEAIVDTPFFPAAFWPKFDTRDQAAAALARSTAIASGTAAVLYGGPLRLNPLQSLANIHVVKGKPGLPAELMVALVQSAGHEVGVEDLTDSRCRVWGKRAGTDTVRRAEFDITRATRAGYVGQNPKYKSDPQSMLYARAMSILCRQMAPEVLKGLSVAEELQDEPDGDAPAPRTRTVQRAAARPELAAPAAPVAAIPQHAAPAPSGPPLPGEDEQPAAVQHEVGQQPADDPDGPLTEKQWRDINSSFVRLGVTGPGQQDKRLRVIGYVVGRQISRGGELTSGEGQLVLDNLAGEVGRRVVAQALAARGDEITRPAESAVEQAAAGLPPLPGEDVDQATAVPVPAGDPGPDLPVEEPPGWDGQA